MTGPSRVRSELSQWLASAEEQLDGLAEHYRVGRDVFGELEAVSFYWEQLKTMHPERVREMLLAAISRMARTEVPGGDR